MRERIFDLVRTVNLSGPQSLAQGLGRRIDENHVVGDFENVVGDRLAHFLPRQPQNRVVEPFEVLDVQRRDDVDAGTQHLEHVVVPFRVRVARGVRVRELVDERDLRFALEKRVEIEFARRNPVAYGFTPRHHAQSHSFFFGVGTLVRFDKGADDVGTLVLHLMRAIEHRIRFAATGRRTDVDREPPIPDAHAVCGRLRVTRKRNLAFRCRNVRRRIDDKDIALDRPRRNTVREVARGHGDQTRFERRELRLDDIEIREWHDFRIEFFAEFRDRIDIAFAENCDVDAEIERVRDGRSLAQKDRGIAVARRECEGRRHARGHDVGNRQRVDRAQHHLAQESQRLRPMDPGARALDIFRTNDFPREQSRFELLGRDVECDDLVCNAQERNRHDLAHGIADEAFRRSRDRLRMLDVERAADGDAGIA